MTNKTQRLAGLLVAIFVASYPMQSLGQDRATTAAAFDVVSIHEDRSGEQDGNFRFANGRFKVTNQAVRWIIRWAYNLREYQVSGLPSWTETRYEVQATYSPPSAGLDAVRAMAQGILADRFSLRAHREQRETRVYHLVKANDNAGPKLTRSDIDCEKIAAQPPAAPGQTSVPTCTAWVNLGIVRGIDRTMPQLARYLDDILGAPVIDKTDLKGYWNFDVQWSVPALGEPATELRVPTVESVAGLFGALQEQLGLKLIGVRAPIDVLVIDSISKPTAN